jgi:hypothetical protein
MHEEYDTYFDPEAKKITHPIGSGKRFSAADFV